MDLGPGACKVWRSGRHCVLSRRQIYSIKQLPIFPPPTPTRTKATLLALKKQQLTARSRWNEDFEGRLLLSHDNRLSLHGIGAAV